MTPTNSLPREGRRDPSLPSFGRLRVVAFVIPNVLLAGLVALDHFVLERILPEGEAHAVMLAIGLAGVLGFSVVIFARLSDLHVRIARQDAALATLEERHRIGMDLHDGAIQSLYGASLVIEDAAERIGEDPQAARDQLRRSVDRLNATIADLRTYVLGLQPAAIDKRSLRESLEAIAEQARSSALLDLTLDLRPDAEGALDPRTADGIFHIAAEALANVRRHARARHAELRLFREDGRVILDVSDDGVGFDEKAAARAPGLEAMAERARSIGGRFELETAAGIGTRVRAEVPLATV